MNQTVAMNTQQFKVKAVTPSFWEVTFANPSINLIDAETIRQLNGLLADIEAAPKLTVVVFKSDDPDCGDYGTTGRIR